MDTLCKVILKKRTAIGLLVQARDTSLLDDRDAKLCLSRLKISLKIHDSQSIKLGAARERGAKWGSYGQKEMRIR